MREGGERAGGRAEGRQAGELRPPGWGTRGTLTLRVRCRPEPKPKPPPACACTRPNRPTLPFLPGRCRKVRRNCRRGRRGTPCATSPGANSRCVPCGTASMGEQASCRTNAWRQARQAQYGGRPASHQQLAQLRRVAAATPMQQPAAPALTLPSAPKTMRSSPAQRSCSRSTTSCARYRQRIEEGRGG